MLGSSAEKKMRKFRNLAMGALIGMWLSSENATAASGGRDDSA